MVEPAAAMPEGPAGRSLRWTWSRLADLGVDDVYDALALRAEVFVVEQNCAYLDPDGIDRSSWHLLGRDDGGRLQAYLRAVDPGVKYDEPSIGRVITSAAIRGSGAGHVLIAEGLARCAATWPGLGIRISAQARLERFYGGWGFDGVGDLYDEDGIPHREMIRPATATAGPAIAGGGPSR